MLTYYAHNRYENRRFPVGPVPDAPTFEHHREALGIGEARPRLSWKTRAGPSWSQVAYELALTRGPCSCTLAGATLELARNGTGPRQGMG
jgi:hypothetical protein